ncbi:MAG: hypothetical protein V3W37_07940 [Candidatus Binatia bacterium]
MAFHWKDGWYFTRITDPNPEQYGWVHIYHIPQDQPMSMDGGHVRDVDIEIDRDSWASIVASVSHENETGFTFGLARALHG